MPDDPSVLFAGWRERHHRGHVSNPRRDYCTADNQDWPCDSARLLAAVEAVLKLADDWDSALAGGSRHPHARAIRKAVTIALTDKGGSRRRAAEFSVGDLISYRPVHEGVEPHRARVERVEDRGLIVLDEQPGMPLTHLVTWDRVIGHA